MPVKVIVIDKRYYEIPDDVNNNEIQLYLATKTGDFSEEEFLDWMKLEVNKEEVPLEERETVPQEEIEKRYAQEEKLVKKDYR